IQSADANGTGKNGSIEQIGEQGQLDELVRINSEQRVELQRRQAEIVHGMNREAEYKKRIRELEDKEREMRFDRASFVLMKKRMEDIENEKERAYTKVAQLEKELSSVKAEMVASEAKAIKLAEDLNEAKEVALRENVQLTREKLEAKDAVARLESELNSAKEQLEESLDEDRMLQIEPPTKKSRNESVEQKELKEEEKNDEAIALILDTFSEGDASHDEDEDYKPNKRQRAKKTDGNRTSRRRGERSGERRKERVSTGTGRNGRKEKAANACNKVELIGKIIRASEVLFVHPITEEELAGMTRDQREHLLISGERGRLIKAGLGQLKINNAMSNLRNALRWYEKKLLPEGQEEEVQVLLTRKRTPKESMPGSSQASAVHDFSDLSCEALEGLLIERYHSLGSSVTIDKLRKHSSEQNVLFLASCMARTTFNRQRTNNLKREIYDILSKLFIYWGKETPTIKLEEEDCNFLEA
ncbi:hypothetical protein PENTCL1PPCAC_25926, partial [Pristionchus entomophagus]